jgi:hypothetical protein
VRVNVFVPDDSDESVPEIVDAPLRILVAPFTNVKYAVASVADAEKLTDVVLDASVIEYVSLKTLEYVVPLRVTEANDESLEGDMKLTYNANAKD